MALLMVSSLSPLGRGVRLMFSWAQTAGRTTRTTQDHRFQSVHIQSPGILDLTGDQLQIAETRLKSLFPQSLMVYGHLFLRNRVRIEPIKVSVDDWPDFNVVVCKPTHDQKSDLFKEICIFAKEQVFLEETLRKPGVIDWTKNLCFGIDACHEVTLRVVASERNLFVDKAVVCHMLMMKDISSLPPVESSGLSMCSLDESHTDLVNETWKYGQGGRTAEMIRTMITNLPSVCVLDAENQPIAWALTFPSCASGMLYVMPEHRGKDLAKVVSISLMKKLHALGYPMYGFIEEGNMASYNLCKSLGATECNTYRAAWLTFSGF